MSDDEITGQALHILENYLKLKYHSSLSREAIDYPQNFHDHNRQGMNTSLVSTGPRESNGFVAYRTFGILSIILAVHI